MAEIANGRIFFNSEEGTIIIKKEVKISGLEDCEQTVISNGTIILPYYIILQILHYNDIL